MKKSKEKKNVNLVFSSSVRDLTAVNESFDRGVMRVAYHGKNRNKMFISKEAFERAIPTIYNCPVVCSYNREEDTIGSHDVEVVKKNGRMRLVNMTAPVGVVPESAGTWWEEVIEENGETHEYLCVEILLWKRQEAYDHIRELSEIDESMEISVLDGCKKEDELYHIESFEFTAFCLLESEPPCFESAGIKLFSLEFKDQYSQMMEDFKREFSRECSQVTTASAADIQEAMKGGDWKVNKDELMLKYGLTAEEIDFETDQMTAEELEERLKETQARKEEKADPQPDQQTDAEKKEADGEKEAPEESAPPEEDEDEKDGEADAHNKAFSLTAVQLREEIGKELAKATWCDPIYGQIAHYYYCDHDTDAMVVYAFDTQNGGVYGFTYAFNGDHVVIDFESGKRKKMVYADFDEGETARGETFSMHQMADMLCENVRERLNAENEVFAQFSDLSGSEAFEKLRGNCREMTIEQIEEKCFALRGRAARIDFSLDGRDKALRIPIERPNTREADEPYGGIFAKYNIGVHK